LKDKEDKKSMELRYKCLILDHDDTAINSTATLHHPAHEEVMRQMRPGKPVISLEGWFEKNFHPGVMEYYKEDLGFSDDEIRLEYDIWVEYIKNHRSEFFPGFLEALKEYTAAGGRITVVSHSVKERILEDYQNAGTLIPEAVYGWEFEEEKRKPSPWPVEQILKEFNVLPEELLIIDDLKPAVLMGQATGVDVAAAGWGHRIPLIEQYMKEECSVYLNTVQEFRDWILQGAVQKS